MPYNGSGSASASASGSYPASADTLIESAKFNALVADFLTMFSTAVCKDGQTTTTQRIPFAAGISTDTINEKTAATGVTIDSVLLKDGGATLSALLTIAAAIKSVTEIQDSNGNELLKFSGTASAVNELTLTNAATGNNPSLSPTGGDTNIGVNFVPKGTGEVQYNGERIEAFAAGTAMVFNQTAAPTGWTKSTTHNDKALRVVSGAASSGGATAFTTVFGSGKATGSHTLTTAEIPAHTHTISKSTGTTGGSPNAAGGGAAVDTFDSGSAGTGGGHDHTLSLDLQYVDVIIATKD